MGHKVHPNGFRLGVYRSWEANWFAQDRDYTKLLHEDLDMRRLILTRLRNAGIAKIETERSSTASNAQMTVTIHTAKPGIVIGKGGASVDQLREDLEKRFASRVRISIQEIKQPELDAQLVAENIASQLERRISHRRAMKQSILRTMRAGAKGVRVALSGRLRGAEMARREQDREGRVPLHTLRADIRFGRAIARTTFGVIGVKCWIYRDLLSPRRATPELERETAPQPDAAGVQSGGGQPGAGGPRAPRGPAGSDRRPPRRRPPRGDGGGRRPQGGTGQGGPGDTGSQGRRPQGPQGGAGQGSSGGGRPPRPRTAERPAGGSGAPADQANRAHGNAPREGQGQEAGDASS